MLGRKDVFIHIGLTKAASSTLQKFFAEYELLRFVNRYETAKILTAKNPFAYDLEKTRDFFTENIRKIADEGKTPVFSHERLGGNPHSGHYDAREIADRLHAAVPNARILLCIREQMGMLASCYKQYVRIGGVRTLNDYLLPVWDQRVPLFEWTFYEYHRIIQYYFGLFGRDNVNVVLVEELQNDPRAFYEGLCGFMGIPCPDFQKFAEVTNPGIADNAIEAIRVMNIFRTERATIRDPNVFESGLVNTALKWHLRGKIFREKVFFPGKQRNIKDEVRKLFQGKFCRSNAITGELIAKKLAVFGYETRQCNGETH